MMVALVLHWFSLKCPEVLFFYLGFLSRLFTNHRTAREGRGHFFNSSLPLSPALLSSWAITAESSPLHIAGSQTRTVNLWLRLTTNYTPSGLATIKLFFIPEKGKLHHIPLKTSIVGYLKNLKISNVADLLFWKYVIFRKSNLPESN